LYVKCTAFLINSYPSALDIETLCRGFGTTRRVQVPVFQPG
jgi:hypothetical protein